MESDYEDVNSRDEAIKWFVLTSCWRTTFLNVDLAFQILDILVKQIFLKCSSGGIFLFLIFI